MHTFDFQQHVHFIRAPNQHAGGSLFDLVASNDVDGLIDRLEKCDRATADINQLCWDASIHALNSALGAAVNWGRVEMIPILLDHGADPMQHLLNNKTPVLQAMLNVYARAGAHWPAPLLPQEREIIWPMLDRTHSMVWPLLTVDVGLFWAAETRRYPLIKTVVNDICEMHKAEVSRLDLLDQIAHGSLAASKIEDNKSLSSSSSRPSAGPVGDQSHNSDRRPRKI